MTPRFFRNAAQKLQIETPVTPRHFRGSAISVTAAKLLDGERVDCTIAARLHHLVRYPYAHGSAPAFCFLSSAQEGPRL